MAQESKSTTGSILFKIFWWIALKVNPQWAHKLMYFGLRDGAFGRVVVNDPALAVTVWGHTFKTPIGIGGGVDKKGNVVDRLMQIGYGFGTFGPYTLEKEMPPKQVYYYRKEKSILVQNTGFRNPGLLKMLPWFVKRRYLPHFVGIDVVIPAESEEQNIKQGRHFTYQEEFVLMAQKAAPYCDFITLDLSHPNSELSMLVVDSSTLVPIVKSVREAVRIAAPIQTPPVLVKIPLDLKAQEITLVSKALLDSGADGVVVSGPLSLAKNSTLQLADGKEDRMGMLYGELIKDKVVQLIRDIYRETKGGIPIIGCGGIFSTNDAFNQICAGATLVQLDHASLVYTGPSCAMEINKELPQLLKAKGFSNVAQAIGSAVQEVKSEQPAVQPAISQTSVSSTEEGAEKTVVDATPVTPTVNVPTGGQTIAVPLPDSTNTSSSEDSPY